MSEKLEQITQGKIAIPASGVMIAWQDLWPGIDVASAHAEKLIPIVGLLTALVYLTIQLVVLIGKLRGQRNVNR